MEMSVVKKGGFTSMELRTCESAVGICGHGNRVTNMEMICSKMEIW